MQSTGYQPTNGNLDSSDLPAQGSNVQSADSNRNGPLKDSGARREFETGAVRDIQQGKGRCDLLPLAVVGSIVQDDILVAIDNFLHTKDDNHLKKAIEQFCFKAYGDLITGFLEVAIHYEQGAIKYAPHNWEKGIPLHCFIDSGVRHYLKFLRGDNDEPHDRAFVWNMLGAIWTLHNKPELDDI